MTFHFKHIDLTNKTIVFTGGTDGMGKVAVQQLAKMGATIMLLGRNPQKTQKVVDELNQIAGKENTVYVPCDLSSQKSVRQAADIILEKCPTIDLVINCAGANFNTRRISEDNMEMSWAVNHLAPFLLNQLLLDRLKASASATNPVRIVNLSSATQRLGHIHFDDIQLENSGWSTLKSYAQAKLAMNACTRKMAKELEGTHVTVNALNPGFIKSNLTSELTGWKKVIGGIYAFFSEEPTENGANRILKVALSDEYKGITGKFIYEDKISKPNKEALNSEIVERVWALSKKHVSLA